MIIYTRNVRAVNGASQITGGGIVSLGGFTFTVPATGTPALLAVSNIFTQPQQFPDGDSTNPAIAFANQTAMGFFRIAANRVGIGLGGVVVTAFNYNDSLLVMSSMGIGWSASVQASGTPDLVMSRDGGGYWSALKDSVLTNVTALYTFRHNSSGTPAANYGTEIRIQGKSNTTIDQDMASIATTWATATHASRKARTVFNVYDTAIREGIRIEASGTAPMIGFLGANAVIRQTGGVATAGGAYTATEQAMLQAVYDCARTFGLLT